MAGKDYQLDLKMRADFRQAQDELRRADTMLGRLQGRLERANIAGRASQAMAIGIGTAIGATAVAGVAMMGKYIANTIEAEKVQAQLIARIKDTGGAARRTLDELNEQAEKLQNITVFDDESIGGVQAMLLTFKQIQGVQFDRATAAVLDLSTAMGMDLNSAALQLGKALNDPVKGLTALGRSGVQFSEDQQKVIKRLVETGQTAKAQDLILAELEAQMGTAAEAARDTLGGAITALKNSFDNLLEGDSGDAGLVGARQAVEDLIVVLNDPETKQGFDNLINGAIKAIGALARFGATLANTTRFVAEEIAARTNGPALDDTVRIEDRIARLKTTIEAVKSLGNVNPLSKLQFLNASELVPGDFLKRPGDVIARLQGELDKEQNKLKIGVEFNEEAAARAAKLAADNAAAAAAGAGGGGGNPDPNPNNPTPTGKPTDPDAAIKRRIASLQEEAAMLGLVKDGEDKASEAAKAHYAITQGEFKDAAPAMKAQLLAAAEALDTKRADIDAEKQRQDQIERSREAYAALVADLRTPAEVAVDTAIAQLDVLNQALLAGAANKDKLDESLGRIVGGAFTSAPGFGGLSPEVGGPFGELGRIDDANARLDTWYQEQLDKLALFRQQRADLNAQWDAQEVQLEAEHQARLQDLQNAKSQVMLAGASQMFGNMADMARAAGGEQSKSYQALFAISKGFAIAQAAVSLGIALAKANEKGFPWSLAETANVIAQFANITSIIGGASFNAGGFADGGYTGPGGKYKPAGIVHAGEGVLNQQEIAALGGPSGFHALRDAIDDGTVRSLLYGWAGYADGGFVTPGPALSAPDWSQLATEQQPANVQNRMRVYLLQDENQLAQRLAQHPAMEKAVVAIAGENGSAIRAEW